MYLLDSDFLIALLFSQESTHQRAKEVFQNSLEKAKLYVLEEVLTEVATVISRKYNQETAIEVIKKLKTENLLPVSLDKNDREAVWQLFFKQSKNGTSVVDCANVVMARKLGLEIVSFDGFYKKYA